MPRKTKDLAAVIRAKLAKNAALADAVEAERFRADVASAIVAARLEAGLTQTELATLAGMQQPAIARMENSQYEGHSLASLERIAKSLGKRLSVEFRPASMEVKAPKRRVSKA